MDNLEQYFKKHRETINESEDSIPEGDEFRFERRWESYSRDRIMFRSGVKRRRKPLWKVIAFPVAASLALIFGVRLLMNPFIKDRQPESGNGLAVALPDTLSPAEVYNLYYDRLLQVRDEIYDMTATMDKEDPDQIYMSVDIITREAIPLIDQLPDEMSDPDKIKVIAEYSQRRIDALNRYKSTLIANNNI